MMAEVAKGVATAYTQSVAARLDTDGCQRQVYCTSTRPKLYVCSGAGESETLLRLCTLLQPTENKL